MKESNLLRLENEYETRYFKISSFLIIHLKLYVIQHNLEIHKTCIYLKAKK